MTSIVMFNPEEWQRHWDVCKHYLRRAWDKSGGRHTESSTRQKLADGEYVLLAAIDETSIKSACVCGVSQYPASNWLTIILCGGDDMVDWLRDGKQALDHLARINHCEGVEVLGRRGWARAMDLKTMGVWMERRV
jgi:hypothetical protein